MDAITKVKKPIEAIQCANTFSLLQRKMYNVLLANAAGNLYPDMTHRIAMRILCHLMGYRSNDYKTIKEKFRELRRMDIEWDVINEHGNKVWTNTSPLSLARVIEGEGICEYEFTPSLVPYLDRPAQYAKFSLAVQAKFKSCYGLALYENCERYKKIGHTRTFDIPTFRKLMGVAEEEYSEFFALKRRVITKAIKEVNQHADFEVEPEYQKRGRAVVSIRFLIRLKERHLDDAKGQSIKEDLLEEVLIAKAVKYFGLAEKDVQKYLKKYGNTYLSEKVEAILSSDSFKKGIIKNMAGYLKKALTENYQPAVSSQSVIEVQYQENEVINSLRQKKHDLMSKLAGLYDNYLSTHASDVILEQLTEENKARLIREFESYITRTYYVDFYEREGLKNIMVSDQFVEFMKKNHLNLLQTLFPFEHYVKQYQPEKGIQIDALEMSLKKQSDGLKHGTKNKKV